MLRGSLCLSAAVLLAACSDGPTPPPPPLSVQKAPTNSGDQQTDTVFATLAPFRVLVRRGTTPTQGVSVSWTRADSGAPASRTTTDPAGIASLSLTFSKVGTHTVLASVTDAIGSPVTFTATATAGHPILRIVSGDNQADTTQARLSADYVVELTDNHGNAFAGAVIDWAVTAGGGTITPARSTTDGSGRASARHTLGTDPGPQTVTATASALAATPRVTFTAMTLGILRVTTTTTGADLDADGYSVSVLHGTTYDTTALLAPNAAMSVRRRPGDYKVTLSLGSVAVNCDTISPMSLTATVPNGGAVGVAFEVACAPARLLAFGSNAAVYTIKVNGTATTLLTDRGGAPAWSPDGGKVAFNTDRDGDWEIYVMAADGTNAVRLTNDPGVDGHPSWSPAGNKIAFTSNRDGNSEIYVMNADGTNPVRLTSDPAGDYSPAWSPDGSKIAFTSNRGGGADIYLMNADGSNLARLTDTGDYDPAWSPDRSKIVFTHPSGSCSGQVCPTDLYVMNSDGSAAKQLLAGSPGQCDPYYGCGGGSAFFSPAWSPDGRWIAFGALRCDYYYGCTNTLEIISADGTRPAQVYSGAAISPAWRP